MRSANAGPAHMISPKPTPLVLLVPMEGLLDFVLRDILTRVGGIDRCVSEFIRITDQLLPERVFIRVVPELLNGSRTPAGVPVRNERAMRFFEHAGFKREMTSLKTVPVGTARLEEIRLKRALA